MEQIIFYPKREFSGRWDILHFIRSNDKNFCGFGETYFSSIKYNSIKGWKKHNSMTMNLICLVGRVEFIFAFKNEFKEWTFSQYILEPTNNGVLNVPPGYFFCFKILNKNLHLISNFSNLQHDENEISRLPLNAIPYKWS